MIIPDINIYMTAQFIKAMQEWSDGIDPETMSGGDVDTLALALVDLADTAEILEAKLSIAAANFIECNM